MALTACLRGFVPGGGASGGAPQGAPEGQSAEGAAEQSPAGGGAPAAPLSPVTANKATIPPHLPSQKYQFFPFKGYWDNEAFASV